MDILFTISYMMLIVFAVLLTIAAPICIVLVGFYAIEEINDWEKKDDN